MRKACWVVFPNFYVITRYNKSRLYAAAVTSLAEAIRARVRRDGRFSAALKRRAHGGDERACRRVGARRQRGVLRSAATIGLASVLPSSTPHWSNELMPIEHALDERTVLVQREQSTEIARVERGSSSVVDGRLPGTAARARSPRRARAREPAAPIARRAIVGVVAAHHQRLRLRERVGDEQRLLVAQRMRARAPAR